MAIDLSEEKLKTLVSEIGPSQCMYSSINVLDEVHVKQSMDKVTEKWGPINCVVNCAGKLITRYSDFLKIISTRYDFFFNYYYYYCYDLLFLLFSYSFEMYVCMYVCIGIAPPMRTLSKKGVAHDLKQFM